MLDEVIWPCDGQTGSSSPPKRHGRQFIFCIEPATFASYRRQQRSAWRNIQGLSFLDVAKAMNRSVDSVEKLWVRGLAKLKQQMDSNDQNNRTNQ